MEILEVDLIRSGFPMEMFDRLTVPEIIKKKIILDEIRKAEQPENGN